MKELLLLLILIPIHCLNGQVEILNNLLLEPSTPIAYREYSNKIVVKGYEQDSTVIVISRNDTLQKYSDYFLYRGSKLEKDTLIVYKQGEIIAQKVYSIENLNKPKIFLNEIRDSLVTVEDILNNTKLIVSYEPQIAIPCSRVIDFYGFIIKKNGKKTPLKREKQKTKNWNNEKEARKLNRLEKKGAVFYSGINQLSLYQIKLIKRMSSGDILNIQDVTLSCPSCSNARLHIDLRLTIK